MDPRRAAGFGRSSVAPSAVITEPVISSTPPPAGITSPAGTSTRQAVKNIDGHPKLYGLSVNKVREGSPAQQAGLVPGHDVIIKAKNAQGAWVFIVDSTCKIFLRFLHMLTEYEGRPLKLRVWNNINYTNRDITIVPRQWDPSEPGSLIGALMESVAVDICSL